MSTIASPRDPGGPFPRRNASANASTPTSSSRPSLETSRSVTGSPNPNTAHASSSSSSTTAAAAPTGATAKRNRAALREYYNLKKAAAAAAGGGGPGSPAATGTPVVEVTDPLGDSHLYSEVPASEMDKADFDAEAYIQKALETNGLEDLLRTYARVLGEIRALDAEKKGLVYDNYSRLIAATETIRKMRANMDPLNPMASTLDPAIAQIYSQAASIRDALREVVPPPPPEADEAARRTRTRTVQLAREVLETPERIRQLVKQGKEDEARRIWEMPRRLLEKWKEQGIGGDDVVSCLEEGDAALKVDNDDDDDDDDDSDGS